MKPLASLQRRSTLGQLGVISVGVAAQCLAPWAHAQTATWPAKPLRIITPFPAGGNIDTLSRALAEQISGRIGQPVLVDPKPGANTILGAQELARASADGHTFMITTMSTTVNNRALYAKLPYDPEKDLLPITQLAYGAVLLVAPSTAPYNDVKGFMAWVRAQKRPVTYGSWGVGSVGHLYGVVLERDHGLQLNHVPYKGDVFAIGDVRGGALDVTFASPTSAKPQIAAGHIKPIGMVGAARSVSMPELATFGEQGVKGMDLPLWVGVYAPASTPRTAIERIRAEIVAAMAVPSVRDRMRDFGFTPIGNSPEEFAANYRADYPKWEALIKASGAKVE